MNVTPNETKENEGNKTTVHNPKAPGQVEKVDPTTGDTTPKDIDIDHPGK